MIFATVGTHEDPFNRLLEALDALKASGALGDEVIAQAGYSTYAPRHFRADKLIPFDEVQRLMAAARIVITHGGPATILQVFSHGKVPVIVPRQHRFGEHVDDHQVRFARRMAGRALVIEDIVDLGPVLTEYAQRVACLPAAMTTSPAAAFAARLDTLCGELLAHRAKGPS